MKRRLRRSLSFRKRRRVRVKKMWRNSMGSNDPQQPQPQPQQLKLKLKLKQPQRDDNDDDDDDDGYDGDDDDIITITTPTKPKTQTQSQSQSQSPQPKQLLFSIDDDQQPKKHLTPRSVQNVADHYWLPLKNPNNALWKARNDVVNKISSPQDIIMIVNFWADSNRTNKTFFRITSKDRPDLKKDKYKEGFTIFFKDENVPVKQGGHPQANVPKNLRFDLHCEKLFWPDADVGYKGKSAKVSRHLVVWRYMNGGALIPEGLHISHVDHDQTVLNLIAESRDLNESRKYCHLFGWYKVDATTGRKLCPHVFYPCTGRQDTLLLLNEQ